MDIQLVNMPWHMLDMPSLALGVLQARVQAQRPGDSVHVLHANVLWAEHMLEQAGADPKAYLSLAEEGYPHGLGDWIFTGALYGPSESRVRQYADHLHSWGIDPALPLRLHAAAPQFIATLAQQICDASVDVVGFTTTFMQNVPSLALARALKSRHPSLHIVFGGANCDGVQGTALHRNHPFVDFVVRGEGERSILELMEALEGARSLATVPGLCWWEDGQSVVNSMSPVPVPAEAIPQPTYDSYFDLVSRSPIGEYVDPAIVLETSRGCWWGEKHHCTFCGLNGTTMKFRSKSADRVMTEIEHMVRRHQSLDILMIDNILNMEYFKTLLPRLAAVDWDVRIHYEVKANLDREKVEMLRDARVLHVQPGIESLSSSVLKLMRKGSTGVQNVRVLRDCEDLGLTVVWNLLYGFPSEDPADYQAVVRQMPNLWHLQPPSWVTPIVLERFSPYFDRPELGFPDRSPAAFYRMIYDLPNEELADLVYVFDAPSAGIEGAVQRALHDAVLEWKRRYLQSRLTWTRAGGALCVSERRDGRTARDLWIEEPWQAHAYLALMDGLSLNGLHRRLHEGELPVPQGAVQEFVGELMDAGLLFADDGRYVALATHDAAPRRAG